MATYFFVIRNEQDGHLYWSNEHGWVSGFDATEFTREERDTLTLPIGGVWEERGKY